MSENGNYATNDPTLSPNYRGPIVSEELHVNAGTYEALCGYDQGVISDSYREIGPEDLSNPADFDGQSLDTIVEPAE